MSLVNQQKLADLAEQVNACQRCPLYKDATQGVAGEGSAAADIMFIGEGPGKEEDKQGRPFCGAAGKFLDTMLESIALSRETVYIANVVKHRPPNNRDPLPTEIEACWPYLEAQIKIIEPKIIAVLGRHSMARFLPNLGTISELHGRAFKKDGRIYVALYHPAVALYNGSMRKVLLEDFKKLQLILEKLQKNGEINDR